MAWEITFYHICLIENNMFFITYVNDVISMFTEKGPKILLGVDDTILYYSQNDIDGFYIS